MKKISYRFTNPLKISFDLDKIVLSNFGCAHSKRLKEAASYHPRNILHSRISVTDFNQDSSVAFARNYSPILT